VVLALVCALVVGGVGACGGDDKSDAEDTVKEFFKATRERDADKFCGELISKEFLQQATGATGDRAQDACKRQVKELRVNIKLVKIKETKIDGDDATVTATLESQGRKQDQVLRLTKEDGDFKLSAGAG
jgi:hypothetical protein